MKLQPPKFTLFHLTTLFRSLGSKFTTDTDYNPLVYVNSSKLGADQIRCMSELVLYDFDIVYRTGRSNLVADALSRRPEVIGEGSEEDQGQEDEQWQAISYQVVGEALTQVTGGSRLPRNLRECIQILDQAYDETGTVSTVEVQIRLLEVFNQITPAIMATA